MDGVPGGVRRAGEPARAGVILSGKGERRQGYRHRSGQRTAVGDAEAGRASGKTSPARAERAGAQAVTVSSTPRPKLQLGTVDSAGELAGPPAVKLDSPMRNTRRLRTVAALKGKMMPIFIAHHVPRSLAADFAVRIAEPLARASGGNERAAVAAVSRSRHIGGRRRRDRPARASR
jgi:hypothetical protein